MATSSARRLSSGGVKRRSRVRARSLSRASWNSDSSRSCSGQLTARRRGEGIAHLLKTTKRKVAEGRRKSKYYFSPYIRLGLGTRSLSTDSEDLAGLDPFELGKAIGHVRLQVFEEDGPPTKNDHRDLSLLQILLVFKSTINRQDNIEICILGCGQKLAVLESGKAGKSGGLTVVARQVVTESFIHTLTEQNTHSSLGG